MRLSALYLIIAATVAFVPGCDPTAPDGLRPGLAPQGLIDFPGSVTPDLYETGGRTNAGGTVGVRLSNAGPATARVTYGTCSVVAWLYPAARVAATPIWQSMRPGALCADILFQMDVPARGSVDIAAFSFGDIAAPASQDAYPPSGTWRLRLAINVSDPGPEGRRLVILDGGTITIP